MNSRDGIRVVSDQVGTPTWARSFASGIWNMVSQNITGVRHWGNTGSASWYDFATEIHEQGVFAGVVHECTVTPVTTSEYPTPAARPLFSVLDHDGLGKRIGVDSKDWKIDLCSCISEISENI
jgi:dTDP-4-dehydrorhamnose reductase